MNEGRNPKDFLHLLLLGVVTALLNALVVGAFAFLVYLMKLGMKLQ